MGQIVGQVSLQYKYVYSSWQILGRFCASDVFSTLNGE